MEIKTIGIIGGTHGIGAVFADFLEQNFPEKHVVVSGRKTKLTNKKLVEKSDLVIFSVPIIDTEKVIEAMVPFSKKNQIWADFTSIKEKPVEIMLRSKAQVCGMHPLFGPLPDIRGQNMIFCPTRILKKSLQLLRKIFADFSIETMTAKKHDRLMGVVQGISHFSDFVMGSALRNSGLKFADILNNSSSSYRMKLEILARIFAQNPDLYADISLKNPYALDQQEKFSDAAKQWKEMIQNQNRKSMVRELEKVRKFFGEKFCRQALRESAEKLVVSSESKDEINKEETVADLAVFGEKDSHTAEATVSISSEYKIKTYIHKSDLFSVFEAIKKGKAKYGFVPYENTLQGSVFETLDHLFEHPDIHIIDQVEKKINQHLIGLPGVRIKDIDTVFSHPQALGQCAQSLRKILPTVHISPERSTTAAVSRIRREKNPRQAAIGSLAAAQGLQILEKNMQAEDNKTRFVLISKGKPKRIGKRVSFVFWFSGDKSGNLAQVLTLFSAEKINLTKLDSRRARKEFGHYLFFIDVAISLEKFKKILPKIKKMVKELRILGTF